MRLFHLITVATLLLAACNNGAGTPQKKATEKRSATVEKNDKERFLGETVMSYWDSYNFADTAAGNIAEGEQRFSNFLMLLNYTDSAIASSAIGSYIKRGYAKRELRGRYDALIRHYLDNPESPMRNDAVYAHFLRCQLACLTTDEAAARSRIEFKLQLVTKNLPGSIATDFRHIDRKGNVSTLHATESPLTLVIFNDPECENCKRIIPQLKREPLLNIPEVKVLMIYPDENTECWKSQQANMPEGWTDAYSPEGEITGKQLYHTPAMPSLYLLDSEKRIILKDAHPEVVKMAIKNILTEGAVN